MEESKKRERQRGTKGHLMSLSFPLGCGFFHSSFAFLLPRHAKKNKDFFLLKGTKTKIWKAHRKCCSSHTFWILYGHTGHSTLKVWQRNWCLLNTGNGIHSAAIPMPEVWGCLVWGGIQLHLTGQSCSFNQKQFLSVLTNSAFLSYNEMTMQALRVL